MRKITLLVAFLATTFAFAQSTIVIERLDDSSTGLISTKGDNAGVYCADFFEIETKVVLDEFTFPGLNSNGLIDDVVDGFNLYIFEDAGGVPLGNPEDAGDAVLALGDIQRDAFTLEEEMAGAQGYSWFTVDVTAANGGEEFTLMPGTYWVAAFPTVFGEPTAAGRWNWFGSLSAAPQHESMLIDPDNLFGAGTDWNTVSDLIEEPFPSFAWTLTGEEILSVGDNQLDQVAVYPNPTSGILNLKTPAGVEVNSVSLFNVLGQRADVSYSQGTIDMSSLARGVYILEANTSAGTLTQKIVKE